MRVIEDVQSFQKVLNSPEVIVVKIGSETCGACKIFDQEAPKLEKEFQDVDKTVNIISLPLEVWDGNLPREIKEIIKDLRGKRFPLILVLENKKLLGEFQGADAVGHIRGLLNNHFRTLVGLTESFSFF